MTKEEKYTPDKEKDSVFDKIRKQMDTHLGIDEDSPDKGFYFDDDEDEDEEPEIIKKLKERKRNTLSDDSSNYEGRNENDSFNKKVLRQKTRACINNTFDYQNILLEITEQPSFSMKKRHLLSDFMKRIPPFHDEYVSLEDSVQNLKNLFNFKTDQEVKNFIGDDEILDIYCSPQKEGVHITLLTEDVYSESLIKSDRSIEMKEIFVNPTSTGSGKGANFFYNQIHQFKLKGIKRVSVIAAKGGYYNGYVVCPKLGLDIDPKDKESVELFQGFLKIYSNDTFTSLVDFVTSSKENAQLWLEKGGSYKGIFDLNDDSPNMKALENYINRKRSNS
jgi:hypothetical protein